MWDLVVRIVLFVTARSSDGIIYTRVRSNRVCLSMQLPLRSFSRLDLLLVAILSMEELMDHLQFQA